MELPNRAAFTFLTHTTVILLRRRLLRAMELTALDLTFAVFQADMMKFKRGALCKPVVLIKSFGRFSMSAAISHFRKK